MSVLQSSVVVEENESEALGEIEDAEADVSGTDSSDEGDTDKKSGWADSMARVLAEEKPKNKSSVILSRAKKESRKGDKKSLSFEIEGEVKEVEVKPSQEDLQAEVARQKSERLERKRKREDLKNLNVRPDITEKSRELALKRVATRGVVQLFNAVRAQQKDISERLETEKLEHKREKVLKNVNKTAFLDALMGGPRAKSELIDNPVKDEEDEDSDQEDTRPSTWNVLRDDFMVPSKKNKDWDKMDEDDEENDKRSEPEESEDSNEESN